MTTKRHPKREHFARCDKEEFAAFLDGRKTSYISLDRDGYQVGDDLDLREWKWEYDCLTGRRACATITYIERSYGLYSDYVALSIRLDGVAYV